MVEGKRPRLDSHGDTIKESVADLLGIDKGRVGLTATSGDELTSFGKGEGLQVFSVASLIRK